MLSQILLFYSKRQVTAAHTLPSSENDASSQKHRRYLQARKTNASRPPILSLSQGQKSRGCRFSSLCSRNGKIESLQHPLDEQ